MWPSEVRSLVPGFALGVAFAFVLTPACRRMARRLGLVAAPSEGRWHRRPTALLGGPAIAIGSLAAFLLTSGPQPGPLLAAWVAGAALISMLGLFDDVRHLRPASKLIGQILVAMIPLLAGLSIPGFDPIVSFLIVLVWIVGITNAMNLLDNMDGLAAGISAIAAGVLAMRVVPLGNRPLTTAAASVAGAALGFLAFNFQPASIFMGDSGSLFLGYSLGTLTLIDVGSRPLVSLSIIAVPLLVLAIPIFDTSLVTVLRILNRRSIAVGGRDHSSHRLVSLGLSERGAVLTLYLLAASAGLSSLLAPRFPAALLIVSSLIVILSIYYFGAYLGSVQVYRTDPGALEQAHRRGFFVLDTFIAHKRRILDVTVDLVIVVISHLGAYLLRWEGDLSVENARLMAQSLPFLVGVRLVSFFAFGLYRTVPGAFSLHDALSIGKAVLTSSALFVTGLVIVARFQGYSRTVMLIDGLLTVSAVCFSRLALRSLHDIFSGRLQDRGLRVLILGAGNLGEAALRLLKTDHGGMYRIVGFLDDDPEKIGRRLSGIPVLGCLNELERILAEEPIEAVVIAVSKLEAGQRAHLVENCRRTSVEIQEIRLTEVGVG